MEIVRTVIVPGRPATAFDLVGDLTAYPTWMDLVHDVKAVGGREVRGGEAPAWEVELRAQVGPLARSKRLRMVRTVHEPDRRVVFERAEVDGRAHAPWVLAADIEPFDVPGTPEPSVELTMTLRYGGNLWTGAILQRVLDDHVERGAQALHVLLTDVR